MPTPPGREFAETPQLAQPGKQIRKDALASPRVYGLDASRDAPNECIRRARCLDGWPWELGVEFWEFEGLGVGPWELGVSRIESCPLDLLAFPRLSTNPT